MRKVIGAALVVAAALFLSSCGNPKTIDGVTYDTYGLFNSDEKKNPDIEYHIIVGNLFWGFILSETLIVPAYFLGWELFEPIGKKPKIRGQIIE